MSGRMQINIDGYTAEDDVTLNDDLFNISVGNTLALIGSDTLIDDAIEGAGRVSVRGPTTIDDGLALSGSTLFVNSSSLDVFGPLQVRVSQSDKVVVRNTAGATLDLMGALSFAGSSELVNLGLLELDATGISGAFVDRGGTIQVESDLAGIGCSSNGGRFVNDTIEGSVEFDMLHGTLVGSTISTPITELQTMRAVGDVTISSAALFSNDFDLGAGAVVSLTNPAARINLSDEIYGEGAFDIKGDDTIISFIDDFFTLAGDVALNNFGDTVFDGHNASDIFTTDLTQMAGFTVFTDPWSNDTVTIKNNAGAVWQDEGASTLFYKFGPGSSVFINDGIFEENTTNGATFDFGVVNDDLMFTNSGSLVFNDSVAGKGAIEVGDMGVTFNGSVGIGQKINFINQTDDTHLQSLQLYNPSQFAGTIIGFDEAGVKDDQISVSTASGWQYQDFIASDDGRSGALMFTNGSGEAAVNLSGSYDSTGFHAVVAGGYTNITYSVS